ncbi:SH3 domain-containing kinase-binding protein 1 isoform X2 [Cephus cinctus]|uniref:SH3 domain-containing kinase-binding protein 1 isoform X2 n=1 Tax=Cephus cinctus TaxID=211228 RepID=A0AAJ7C3E3_CEPCN|nr:SH3 domain-containing kinase-binding protein 1 isoform X2 [Cephus cinctus]
MSSVLEHSLGSGGGGGGGSGGGEGTTSGRSEDVTLRNGSGRKWCKVLFSYDPCNEDELTLIPQDSIEYLGEVEEGWWKGRLRGRIGVFPSNFVSPPTFEEADQRKERDKRELCRVLFPYEAANDDELTLVENEVITIISKDAPDKGWWKGELRGQVGLFPDNFVEILDPITDHHYQDQDSRHDSSHGSTKSNSKHSLVGKRSEKAHVRKSLDARNSHSEATKKATSTSSSSSLSSLSGMMSIVIGANGDKKCVSNRPLLSTLKRFVGDGSSNAGLGEELDGVERGEGAPLSHLTASRAKAPRRRPPSTQHLRHHTTGSSVTTTSTSVSINVASAIMEDSLSNGNVENVLDQLREEDTDSPTGKTRKKAPWVEELKMSQLEKRKSASTDRIEKTEVKKERNYSKVVTTSMTDSVIKQETEGEEIRPREKERGQRIDSTWTDHPIASPSTPGPPVYVPYHLYSQLLERVAALEENQAMLQRTVSQLSEQLVPLLANTLTTNKTLVAFAIRKNLADVR